MGHELENTIALLERTPGALDALLRGLPEVWTETNEGGDTWSVSTVDRAPDPLRERGLDAAGAADSRIRRGRALCAFRPRRARALQGKQNAAATARRVCAGAGKGLEELRGLKLTAQDLERRGRHPAFGAVTLSELLTAWAAHDLTHVHQISRIMAYQVREAAGPWVRFMGVMQCAGARGIEQGIGSRE